MDASAKPEPDRALKSLLKSLMREFFQTETSAVMHCRREAERLGEAPPARTLRELADQAEKALNELPKIAEAYALPKSKGGIAVGELFSEARDKLFDRLLRSERSYRGTVLGVRHGVDLVALLAPAAQQGGLDSLRDFCERWLTARRPLVERLEGDLAWFAKQPAVAMRFAR
jgi:hypothetical protein